MRKPPEHILAAIKECEISGVAYKYQVSLSNKIEFVMTKNDVSRTIYLSKTPSDWRAPMKVKRDIRRVIHTIESVHHA